MLMALAHLKGRDKLTFHDRAMECQVCLVSLSKSKRRAGRRLQMRFMHKVDMPTCRFGT